MISEGYEQAKVRPKEVTYWEDGHRKLREAKSRRRNWMRAWGKFTENVASVVAPLGPVVGPEGRTEWMVPEPSEEQREHGWQDWADWKPFVTAGAEGLGVPGAPLLRVYVCRAVGWGEASSHLGPPFLA